MPFHVNLVRLASGQQFSGNAAVIRLSAISETENVSMFAGLGTQADSVDINADAVPAKVGHRPVWTSSER